MTSRQDRKAARLEKKLAQKTAREERNRKAQEDWEKLSPGTRKVYGWGCSLIVVVLLVLVIRGCGSGQGAGDAGIAAVGTEAAPESVATAQLCGASAQITQIDYAVRAEQTMLSAPQPSAAPVIWDTGTSRLPAPAEERKTVREWCRQGDWSLIRVLSSVELHKLQGWVPSSSLRDVPRTEKGRRIYVASDFDWPAGSKRDQQAVLKIVNRIMTDRPECEAMDVDSLVLNGNAYSIPCFTSSDMTSFSFTAADAANGRSFIQEQPRSFIRVQPIGKQNAIQACKAGILARANHPSTVDFPAIDYTQTDQGGGRTQLRTSFTAKNGFGLELSFDAICMFTGNDLTNVLMSETRGM